MDDYKIWEPIDNIPFRDLYFFGLRDDLGKLVILLKELGSHEKMLEMVFSNVLGYRVVQESGRMRTMDENPGFSKFMTSTNSDFLIWFKEESRELFDDWKLVHYVICNCDNIIDVISGLPVSVEWVPSND